MTDDDIVYEEVPSPAEERAAPSFDPWGVVCILLLAAAALEILAGIVTGVIIDPGNQTERFLITPLTSIAATWRQRASFFATGANLGTGLLLVAAMLVAVDRRPANWRQILQLVFGVSVVVALLGALGFLNAVTTPRIWEQRRFGFFLTTTSTYMVAAVVATTTAVFGLRESLRG